MPHYKSKFGLISLLMIVILVIITMFVNFSWQKHSEKQSLLNVYMPLVSKIIETNVSDKNQTLLLSAEQIFLTFTNKSLREDNILNHLKDSLSHSPFDFIYYISAIDKPTRYYCYKDRCGSEILDFSNPFDAWFTAFVENGAPHSVAIATTPHKDKKVFFNNFLFREGQKNTFAAFGTGNYLNSRMLGKFLHIDELPISMNIMNEYGELILEHQTSDALFKELAHGHLKSRWSEQAKSTNQVFVSELNDHYIASKYLLDISTTGVLTQNWYLVITLDSEELFGDNTSLILTNALIGIIYLIIFMLTVGKQFRKYDKSLQKEALYDKLTGKPNRKMLNRAFEHIVDNLNNEKSPYTFIIFDLDSFKPINDTYGHLIGDKILIRFANELSNAFRDSDMIGRLGGDEFICLLKSSSSQADKILNRTQKSFFEKPFTAPNGDEIHISFSYGMEPIVPQSTFDDVYKIADANLYENKKLKKASKQ